MDSRGAKGETTMKYQMGERIRAAREALGSSQQEMAEALDITRAAVSLWEKNESQPDRRHWDGLAKYLKVTLAFLLTGEGPKPVKPRTADKRKFTTLRLRNMIMDGEFDELIYPRIEALFKAGALDELIAHGKRNDQKRTVETPAAGAAEDMQAMQQENFRQQVEALIQYGALDKVLARYGYHRGGSSDANN